MSRLGEGRYVDQDALPVGTVTTVHTLDTCDEAKVTGVLRVPAGVGAAGARAVVMIMHPRQDVTNHGQVPLLLRRGYAVWTQGSRSPNNDLSLLHEQCLLDVAAGVAFLREHFDRVVTLGHSGGGTLFAFYLEQASLAAGARLTKAPSGRPVPLDQARMPLPDGAVFLAPHPGQGELLLGCIDPSVVDESDPLSVDPALDPFSPSNGFAEPPESARYDASFLERYAAAQRARVARLDERARRWVAEADEARAAFKTSARAADRRRSLAPRLLAVYRTDADPRTVDLHLDPSERPYGSVFGKRPDLINYGLVGFGRLSTAEAWLSTWSGLSSKASFLRCAPAVTVPTLLVGLSGDQAAFPSVTERMHQRLGAADKTYVTARGTHFGGAIARGEPTGHQLAGEIIGGWLDARWGT